MSTEETNFLVKVISEQGVLGSMVMLLFLSWRSTIAKLITLVQNNTEAMTNNANALRSIQDAIKKCEK